ncbi:hypothetical protein PFISCL1PPCAC_14476 [Pristionchus fissidentatus]|uniref:glutathione transferase n=1 Tax=Pristionchus fissidentatus TaxID=1538716 RepID=A0AAV5VUE5_9BILA|nr:hypothetical protein PFISCL1PPCAC_14476 [Pristionchus fissidentatus]
MPTYKLTYFPARGSIEVARQLFHLAEVPFEDVRIPMAEWPALKQTMPFPQIPLLEVDWNPLPQSYAIFRYLAKQFGKWHSSFFICCAMSQRFAGNSPFESAWIDAIADQYKDYLKEMQPALVVYTGFSQGDKEKLVKEVAEPARDKFFGVLEKIAKESGSNGHFVGSSLTWVDLLIADHVNVQLHHLPNFLNGFPIVVATTTKIEQTPKLKEWIETRPQSSF